MQRRIQIWLHLVFILIAFSIYFAIKFLSWCFDLLVLLVLALNRMEKIKSALQKHTPKKSYLFSKQLKKCQITRHRNVSGIFPNSQVCGKFVVSSVRHFGYMSHVLSLILLVSTTWGIRPYALSPDMASQAETHFCQKRQSQK